MTYNKTTWTNDSGEPINATNLNKIEQGLADAAAHTVDNSQHTDTVYDDTILSNAVALNTAKVGITTQQINDITANNAKETNIVHPLVETAVPVGALFTDTVYDDTAIQVAVALNSAKVGITTQQASDITSNNAKVSNVVQDLSGYSLTSHNHGGVYEPVDANIVKAPAGVLPILDGSNLTGLPSGYDDSAVLKDSDTVSPVTTINKLMTASDVANLGGGDMLKATYDTTNNGIVDNAEKVNGLTVETAVPVGAVFTDTDTQLTTEQVQDMVNDLFQAGTHTNVTVTYNDVANSISLSGSASSTNLTQEQVEDYVGGVVVGGTGISVTYNDIGDQLSIALAGVSFTSTLLTKLNGIADNATADQTASEIKIAYESNLDTNSYTDAEKALLASALQSETSYPSDGLVAQDITDIQNLSGVNTGDQDLSGKQDTLVSGTSIKTVNGNTLLGLGDVDVGAYVQVLTQVAYDALTPDNNIVYVIQG